MNKSVKDMSPAEYVLFVKQYKSVAQTRAERAKAIYQKWWEQEIINTHKKNSVEYQRQEIRDLGFYAFCYRI